MLTLFADAAPATNSLWNSGAFYYMKAGGPFMWPILFLAVLGSAVVLERFRTLRLLATDGKALRDEVLDLLRQGQVDEAMAVCARARGPVPAVLAAGLHRYELLRTLNYDPARTEEQVVKAMDDYGVHLTAALEKHLPVLGTVASVAPMLGSLGTVVGMVMMFEGIVSKYGKEDIILSAAAGIKEKLIVTVWGLLVGIVAYICYNYFTTVVNRYVLEAEDTASKLIEALTFRLAAGGTTPTGHPVSAGGGMG